MTAYTKSTNFATKDTLTSGDPLKIVKGTEINTEFDNIATAVNSKSDTASPTFTGVATLTANPVLSAGTANGVTYLNGSKSLTSGSAITFDGTNFATTGTATATKLIPTGTSVTGNGLYLPAANALGLSTNGTNAVYIDSSQNVGIGTSSPSQKLTLGSGFVQTGNGTGGAGGVWFPYGSDASTRSWRARTDIVGYGDWGLEQSTTQTGTTFATNFLIDASGNVGIGTSSPAGKLDVSQSTAGFARHYLRNTSNSVSAYTILDLVNDSGNNIGEFFCTSSTNTGAFGTNATVLQAATSNPLILGTNGTERMRIDSSGNFTVSNGSVYFTGAQYRSNVASSQLQFINNSAGVSLAVNGTSWGSLSDERDKEIIEPITNAISKVLSLRSVIGRYKIDDEDKRRSFLIAQDVKAVLPEAVTELDDEQKTLILQYTEIIPLLVASIKEQQALITALTARITVLENK